MHNYYLSHVVVFLMQVSHWKQHERFIITHYVYIITQNCVLLTQVSRWNGAPKDMFTNYIITVYLSIVTGCIFWRSKIPWLWSRRGPSCLRTDADWRALKPGTERRGNCSPVATPSAPQCFCIHIYIVTECVVCVSGYDPLTFLSYPFPFWLGGSLIGWEFYGPNYLKC